MGLTRINNNQLKAAIDTQLTKSSDGDLIAIADITDSATGYLKKIGKDTWALDQSIKHTPTVYSGQIIQTVCSTIPIATGTTIIAVNNAEPTVAAGAQIWSNTITPTANTSKILIKGSFLYNSGTASRQLIAFLFRGTTCIGATGAWVTTATTSVVPVNISFVDIPASTSPVTYSVRVGGTSAHTWRINQFSTPYFAGHLDDSAMIMQELA